jgi:hypothetical protein
MRKAEYRIVLPQLEGFAGGGMSIATELYENLIKANTDERYARLLADAIDQLEERCRERQEWERAAQSRVYGREAPGKAASDVS